MVSFNFGGRNGLLKTNYNRKFRSPTFQFSNSATIATTEFKLFDYFRDTPATEKYGAFNNCRIQNSSNSEILVYPNQNRNTSISVAPGTTSVIDQETFPSTTSLLIENVGSSSITANQIRVQVWKNDTTISSLAQNLHKRLFGEPLILDRPDFTINGGVPGVI